MDLTDHALDRLAERGIALRDVELVLATAHRRVMHRHGSTSHHGFALDGRAIVVVTETDDHDRIVTVMELA
ncbi:MAG: DUF4258 domain-containing protein [Solirubrobacteraceae bacterium]|nr:DUF4258 domain-containing protein [Solirubrobacteraceae bacterium]